MAPWLIVLLIVLGVLIAAFVVLTIIGKKNQKKQEAQRAEMEKQAQTMSLYIIDKKKLRIKDAGLPKFVYESTPKLGRIGKMPILKVKVGPKVMSLVCDADVYKTLLPMMEVRARVAGMYVLSAKRIRGPVYEPEKHKKKVDSFLDKLR